jgi:hypothetical protein
MNSAMWQELAFAFWILLLSGLAGLGVVVFLSMWMDVLGGKEMFEKNNPWKRLFYGCLHIFNASITFPNLVLLIAHHTLWTVFWSVVSLGLQVVLLWLNLRSQERLEAAYD